MVYKNLFFPIFKSERTLLIARFIGIVFLVLTLMVSMVAYASAEAKPTITNFRVQPYTYVNQANPPTISAMVDDPDGDLESVIIGIWDYNNLTSTDGRLLVQFVNHSGLTGCLYNAVWDVKAFKITNGLMTEDPVSVMVDGTTQPTKLLVIGYFKKNAGTAEQLGFLAFNIDSLQLENVLAFTPPAPPIDITNQVESGISTFKVVSQSLYAFPTYMVNGTTFTLYTIPSTQNPYLESYMVPNGFYSVFLTAKDQTGMDITAYGEIGVNVTYQTLNSSWLTNPVILDGEMGVDEWTDANRYEGIECVYRYYPPPYGFGGPYYYMFTVWLKNNETHLFIFIEVTDDLTLNDGDYIGMWFDATGEGAVGGPGDDKLYVSIGWTSDEYIETWEPGPATDDQTLGGQKNVEGARSTTTWTFEFCKELNSGDGYDVALSPGDIILIGFIYRDTDTFPTGPEAYSKGYFLRLAQPPIPPIVILTPEQKAAIAKAEEVCSQIDTTNVLDKTSISEAFQTLTDNGLISMPTFTFQENIRQNYLNTLQKIYGENLQHYPTVEGRIWLLHMLT